MILSVFLDHPITIHYLLCVAASRKATQKPKTNLVCAHIYAVLLLGIQRKLLMGLFYGTKGKNGCICKKTMGNRFRQMRPLKPREFAFHRPYRLMNCEFMRGCLCRLFLKHFLSSNTFQAKTLSCVILKTEFFLRRN